MTLPTFTSLGTIYETPSWLSATDNGIYFGRPFPLHLYADDLPDLPDYRWAVYYSSDHSSGAGYIGVAFFDDIEDAWTDHGSYIYTSPNQGETPCPVYDAENNRINIYFHKNVSTGTYGHQATYLATTKDGTTLTEVGEVINDGQHCGYAQVVVEDGVWKARHFTLGGEGHQNGQSISSDGINWTRDLTLITGQQHIAGEDKMLGGHPVFFRYDGQLYRVGMLRTRPQLDNPPTVIVAWPVDEDTLRPNGGYYTLITAAAGETFRNDCWVGEVDGELYALFTVRDSDGNNRLDLARATSTATTQVSPLWPVNSNGSLKGPTGNISLISWDADSDDLPDAFTVTAQSGSDQSNHVSGSYFELKTGSGSSQDVRLESVARFNPSLYPAFEFTIEGLTLIQTNESTHSFLVNVSDAYGAGDGASAGVRLFWQGATGVQDRQLGQVAHWQSDGTETNHPGYIWPFSYTASTAGEYARSRGVDLTIRIHDFGKRLSILIDGQVSHHRDIAAVADWNDQCFVSLRFLTANPHPQVWARFTGLSVTTFAQRSGKFAAGEVYHPGIQKVQVGLGV